MCLIALAWQADPLHALVVAANRDEWRKREAKAAYFWPEHPELLAGRDLAAGGTWMEEGNVTGTARFEVPAA